MTNPFLSEFERYLTLARENSATYRQATPFPHIVFDDFVCPDQCHQLIEEFEDPASPRWLKFDDPTGVKLASRSALQFGPITRQVLDDFNSAPFLEFLEALTGISGLIPDPWFEGGGLHQIPPGGYLKIHADFNWHKRLRLDRRINVLLYLNQNWREEYGGPLELWDRDMAHCEQRILPLFNRCVIFNTTDVAFHGHPEPLTCPETMTRKSLALYYYSNGRPEEEKSESHSTLYHATPQELQKMRSFSFRWRNLTYRCLEGLASLAHKPSGLLRKMAQSIRPRY